jgi:hypothetical protein
VLVELELPFVDARASDLALTLGEPAAPALQVLAATVNGIEVELRVLGCSHQVLAQDLSETVACRPGAEGDLPALAEDGPYRFKARVEPLTATRAATLLAGMRDDPNALVAVFPGPKDAFTGMRVYPVPGGAGWVTWHAYPQTGELVCTRSHLVPA